MGRPPDCSPRRSWSGSRSNRPRDGRRTPDDDTVDDRHRRSRFARARRGRSADLQRSVDLRARDGTDLRACLAVPVPRIADPGARRLLRVGDGPGQRVGRAVSASKFVQVVVIGEYGHAIGGPTASSSGNVEFAKSWRATERARAAPGPVGIEVAGHPSIFPTAWGRRTRAARGVELSRLPHAAPLRAGLVDRLATRRPAAGGRIVPHRGPEDLPRADAAAVAQPQQLLLTGAGSTTRWCSSPAPARVSAAPDGQLPRPRLGEPAARRPATGQGSCTRVLICRTFPLPAQ